MKKNKKIVIIEDNRELLQSLAMILKLQDYQVKTLFSTENAVSRIREFDPDLLLLDLWVEPISGDELARELTEDEQLKDLPILLISAADELGKLSREVGVADYLEKPFDFSQLLQKVEGLVT